MDVEKYGTMTPLSDALISRRPDGDPLRAAFERIARMTPEEMAANRERVRAERSEIREHSPRVPFDPAAVEDKMGWKRGFLEHLAQPYCRCDVGYDGWDFCPHAVDLGLTP